MVMAHAMEQSDPFIVDRELEYYVLNTVTEMSRGDANGLWRGPRPVLWWTWILVLTGVCPQLTHALPTKYHISTIAVRH